MEIRCPRLLMWPYVALRLEKVMEFRVQAGLTLESILDLKVTKEDQDQQTRMWLIFQNFLRRALKGAYPDKETYSYFREDEGNTTGFGGTSLQLPALGVILVNRERFRYIQTSICASQCGTVLPEGLRMRIC